MYIEILRGSSRRVIHNSVTIKHSARTRVFLLHELTGEFVSLLFKFLYVDADDFLLLLYLVHLAVQLFPLRVHSALHRLTMLLLCRQLPRQFLHAPSLFLLDKEKIIFNEMKEWEKCEVELFHRQFLIEEKLIWFQ